MLFCKEKTGAVREGTAPVFGCQAMRLVYRGHSLAGMACLKAGGVSGRLLYAGNA